MKANQSWYNWLSTVSIPKTSQYETNYSLNHESSTRIPRCNEFITIHLFKTNKRTIFAICWYYDVEPSFDHHSIIAQFPMLQRLVDTIMPSFPRLPRTYSRHFLSVRLRFLIVALLISISFLFLQFYALNSVTTKTSSASPQTSTSGLLSWLLLLFWELLLLWRYFHEMCIWAVSVLLQIGVPPHLVLPLRLCNSFW